MRRRRREVGNRTLDALLLPLPAPSLPPRREARSEAPVPNAVPGRTQHAGGDGAQTTTAADRTDAALGAHPCAQNNAGNTTSGANLKPSPGPGQARTACRRGSSSRRRDGGGRRKAR